MTASILEQSGPGGQVRVSDPNDSTGISSNGELVADFSAQNVSSSAACASNSASIIGTILIP